MSVTYSSSALQTFVLQVFVAGSVTVYGLAKLMDIEERYQGELSAIARLVHKSS